MQNLYKKLDKLTNHSMGIEQANVPEESLCSHRIVGEYLQPLDLKSMTPPKKYDQ